MSTPIEMVEVTCPACGEVFAAWHVPTADDGPESRCPNCHHDLATDPTLRRNGAWPLIEPDEALERS